MKKFFNVLLFTLLISAIMCVGAFASDFDNMRDQAVVIGVDSDVIGDENALVKSADAEKFLEQLASKTIELDGEYALTAEYLSAVLEILGYSAENGDFLAEFPYDKAAQIGVLKSLAPNSVYLTNRMMLEYAFAAKGSASALSDMPEIIEGDSIVGLTNFYDPSVSENIVDVFSGDLPGLKVTDSNKFSVSVIQGAGIYNAEVKQIDKLVLSNDFKIEKGNYFSAYAFSGAELTVNVSLHSDIDSTFEVFSTKESYSAEFVDGVLSINVSEPQTLKVVFDGSVGKSIMLFIGELDVDTPESAGKAVASDVTANRSSGEASKVYNGKILINDSVVYYPVYFKDSAPYISDQLYVGEYDGDDSLTVDGDVYIPVSSFTGNGDIENAEYDPACGIIRLTKKISADYDKIGEFVPVDESAAKVSYNGEKVSIEFVDSNRIMGGLASLDIGSLSSVDCLKLTSVISMTGSVAGVPIELKILGYNDLGETAVIASSNERAFSRTYDTTVYFDVSDSNGVFENCYLVVTSAVSGITVTFEGTDIFVFDLSSEMGDNEFNPF